MTLALQALQATGLLVGCTAIAVHALLQCSARLGLDQPKAMKRLCVGAEALQLAGVDYLVVGQKVLSALSSTATMQVILALSCAGPVLPVELHGQLLDV